MSAATSRSVTGHRSSTDRDSGGARGPKNISCAQMFQGAHVTVTQRVEDKLQLTPGGSDRADDAASAVGDPLPQHPDLAGLGDGLDRLDRRPTDQT